MKADLKAVFGEVLKDLRLSQGLTQQALADFSGLDRKFISRLETGSQMPSLETVFKLSKHLKIKPKDFVDKISHGFKER